jgi:6-phosphogluconolactonase
MLRVCSAATCSPAKPRLLDDGILLLVAESELVERMTAKQLCVVVALVTLLELTGCGSLFDRVHSWGTCTVSTYLFATELNTISAFKLSASGAPSLLGSQAGPNSTEGIVADSSGTFLFISDFQNGSVDVFAIDSQRGTLSPVAGSPFTAGLAPGAGGIAVDPSTKFLYVTLLNSSAVAGFTIAPGTGVLTRIMGSPFPARNTPMRAIVDPSGKFLYVSNLNDSMGGISAYTIDSTSGELTAVVGSPFPTQPNFPGPNCLAIGGGGKFLYVGMSGTVNANNGISGFIIDSGSGVLTQITGSPFTTGSDPQGIASDPAGKFLFTANSHDSTVSSFAIDSVSGALSPVSGSPFVTEAAPTAIAVDPAGQFLFVGESGNSGISVFSIFAATGAISSISGSPFSTGNGVNGLAVGRP